MRSTLMRVQDVSAIARVSRTMATWPGRHPYVRTLRGTSTRRKQAHAVAQRDLINAVYDYRIARVLLGEVNKLYRTQQTRLLRDLRNYRLVECSRKRRVLARAMKQAEDIIAWGEDAA